MEGYNGKNGWAIGEEREYKDEATQDAADALSLYTTLEDVIIPLYYERDATGVPTAWVELMKEAIRSNAPRFSMMRMVKEYTTRYYLPAAQTGLRYAADHFALAREIAQWKQFVRQRWPNVHVQAVRPDDMQLTVGGALGIRRAHLVQRHPGGTGGGGDRRRSVGPDGVLENPQVTPLQAVGDDDGAKVYRGALKPETSGQFAVGIRARPTHPGLIDPNELGLASWAS